MMDKLIRCTGDYSLVQREPDHCFAVLDCSGRVVYWSIYRQNAEREYLARITLAVQERIAAR